MLMSLWKVDDARTKEFMTLFYQNWLAPADKTPGGSPADTLRRALAETIRTARENGFSYWDYAAFVLVENQNG